MGLILQESLKRPLLQVALDFTDLKPAIEIASKVVEADVDILEIGTPLAKTYGILAAKEIKRIAKEKLVLADLKAVDAIALEFTPYANEGVDAVTILGIVDDDVIKEAYEICKNLRIDLIVDMIYVSNPVERAFRLSSYGISIVNLHVGVDVQRKRGVSARQLLKEVEELAESDIIVSIAGGIKPEDVDLFIKSGARIIVIGSAITKSADPYRAAKIAVEKLRAAKAL
uniref:D-arabino 3-hexulose 6-phosphate aldehyde lyase n=1 Tax=Ignisphaera aggregans TaxID=334771 RepID=A0A7C4FCS3_9CREN